MFPFVIGIAGGSGSGKSVLTEGLANALNAHGGASVLAMDSYYHDSTKLTPDADGHHNFDAIEAIDVLLFAKHLTALKQGQTVDRPEYNFATHRRKTETVAVTPRTFVIAEGIMLLAVDEIRRAIDLAVFLDVEPTTRLERRIARDTAALGERQRESSDVLRQWSSTVQPFYEAHIVDSIKHAQIVLGKADLQLQTENLRSIFLEAFRKAQEERPTS